MAITRNFSALLFPYYIYTSLDNTEMMYEDYYYTDEELLSSNVSEEIVYDAADVNVTDCFGDIR